MNAITTNMRSRNKERCSLNSCGFVVNTYASQLVGAGKKKSIFMSWTIPFSLPPRLAPPETPWPGCKPPHLPHQGPGARDLEVPRSPGSRRAPQVPQLCPELKWKRGLLSVSLRVRQPHLGRPACGVLGGRVQRWPPGPTIPKSQRPGESPTAGPVLGLRCPLPMWGTGGRARSPGPASSSSGHLRGPWHWRGGPRGGLASEGSG